MVSLLESLINYKKVVAQTKKTLKEEKKNAFIMYCESINKNTRISDIWKKIKTFKNGLNRPVSMDGNKMLESSAEKCLEDLCKPKDLTNTNITHTVEENDNNDIDNQNHLLDTPFSYEELINALCYANTKSSPGIDKIDYTILNFLTEPLKRILLDLYNDLYHNGNFPKQWSSYLVSFIPKGDNSKVRPISMASCILKTLERMINNRLTWWLESNNLLSSSQ